MFGSKDGEGVDKPPCLDCRLRQTRVGDYSLAIWRHQRVPQVGCEYIRSELLRNGSGCLRETAAIFKLARISCEMIFN